MPAINIEEILGPEPPRPPDTTDPAYKEFPQEGKKAWRKYIEAKQQLKLEAASLGFQPEDLGITGEKEHGQSFKRMLERFGMLDRNYEYDIASGRKRNVATSDEDAKARGNWEPMTARDIEEYKRHQGGESWRDVWNRMGYDSGTGKLNQWAINNQARGAGIRKDESGRFYDIGDNGQKIFFDQHGVQVDESGNRTGNIYGASRMRFGSALSGAGLGSNFGGTGGMWGQNTPAAAGPAKPAPTPYYRPQSNPWGSPSHQSFAPGPQQSFGGQPSFMQQSPSSPISSAQPLRMKRRFGAPA